MLEAFWIAPPGFGWWLVVGLVLCAAETLAPGAFLIWVGAAAILVGLILMATTLSATVQLLLFALAVVGLVLVGRRVYGSLEKTAPPHEPGRAEALIGRDFYLEAPIVRGYGAIRVADSVWRVSGAEIESGAKVRVTGVVDGALLKVERA